MRVVWEIDIDAASATEAAVRALEIMRDTHSTALVFYVDGKTVDLQEF